MKSIVLFFYRNDDVILNLFFIMFFSLTVKHNLDNITVAIIFGLIDLGFILYTLGRIFGKIKHFPRIKIDDEKIVYQSTYGKKVFMIEDTGFTRSTSFGGVIDIMRLSNLKNNKQRTIFLNDLSPDTRKKLLEIYKKN